MSGGFPAAGLLTQLFRQLTKPLSKKIVNYAKSHPVFSKYGLIIPGHWYYRLEQNLKKVRENNFKIDQRSNDLIKISDERAIEIATQLMIEIVVFSLLVLLLVMEWLRQSLKVNKDNFEDLNEIKNKIQNIKNNRTQIIEGLHDDLTLFTDDKEVISKK